MTALHDVLTITEISAKYGIVPQTVLRAIEDGRFTVDKDCRRSGNVWLILASSAEKLWGYKLLAPPPPGQRRCKSCHRCLPEDKWHFKPYRISGKTGLSRVCLDCIGVQDAAWYQRNKVKLRPYRREMARQYRAANPDYNAKQLRRSKARRRMEEGRGL